MKILMIEKGRAIENRNCPEAKNKKMCWLRALLDYYRLCGAGAFSDGKLSLSPDVGGNLPEILGYEQTEELLHEGGQCLFEIRSG